MVDQHRVHTCIEQMKLIKFCQTIYITQGKLTKLIEAAKFDSINVNKIGPISQTKRNVPHGIQY